ncbi:uncharacterized protein LOC129785613 isoform X1 [Falco peregrinus]|uniref:uncharacterized protein LOC129785613 isoform X1 n=1 Tax=Falco peregrinus TaxID=8954 RepID=UPI00247A9083|nr:uncharacterized protein LOC129785613 isoform X1 [Falco peregrinus]
MKEEDDIHYSVQRERSSWFLAVAAQWWKSSISLTQAQSQGVFSSPQGSLPGAHNRGEAMEQGLRDCCRSIRIGKILIQSDEETQRAKVYYAKFPPDIYRRKVLLMYPILSTGNTVIEAVKVLVEHGVQPSVIILLSLFSTPQGKLRHLPSLIRCQIHHPGISRDRHCPDFGWDRVNFLLDSWCCAVF